MGMSILMGFVEPDTMCTVFFVSKIIEDESEGAFLRQHCEEHGDPRGTPPSYFAFRQNMRDMRSPA